MLRAVNTSVARIFDRMGFRYQPPWPPVDRAA